MGKRDIFMKNMLNFLQMGGYATYVWSAYGIALLVLVGNIVLAVRCSKRLHKEIGRQCEREKLHAS
jgi:heme exporter protein D